MKSTLKSNYLVQLLISIIISYLVGKAGFFISEGSGFAALIWPPAGISIVLLIYWGYRIAPGLFIGIFLTTFPDIFTLIDDPVSLLIPPHRLIITAGSVLQAIAAVFLLKKYNLLEHEFINTGKVFGFFAIIGPLCSLINATLAVFTLQQLGYSSFNSFTDEWLIWWISDSCSAIIFATLFIAIIEFGHKRRKLVASFIILWLIISFVILNIGKAWEQERLDLIFDQKVNASVDTLSQFAMAHMSLANNLKGFKSYRQNMTRLELAIFAQNNLPQHPNVRSISWIERVQGKDREGYQENLREIFGDESILLWQSAPNGLREPAHQSDEYTVVKYIEPYETYQFAVGHVVNFDKNREATMNLAAKTGELTMTAPVVLISEPTIPSATTIYQAHFNGDELTGFTAVLIRIDNMIKEILKRDSENSFYVHLYDKEDGEQLTFKSYGNSKIDLSGLKSTTIEFPIINRTWVIEFIQTPEFIENNKTSQPLFIGITGLIFAALATVGIVILSGQPIVLEKVVYQRTYELEQANKAKSEFMANMSHDLRTPLNAIIGFSEIMCREIHGKHGNDKYLEYSRDINTSSEYLLSLINDILDLSAIDANKRSIEKEELNINMLVADCIRTLKPLIDEKNQDVIINIPDEFDLLYADERSVKQILINLISNAIKFTPNGGTITVECGSTKKSNVLIVKDTGEGIAKSNLTHILDPFARADSHPHISREGTGLGLTIVNSLVKLHGGSLSIKSELGKGTKVTIKFPKKNAEI